MKRKSLPVAAGALLGRERELTELHNLVSSTRAVTLAGPGGIGKTRLALEVAAIRARAGLHGWFVDLATAPVGRPLAGTVLEGLGVRTSPDQGQVQALIATLGQQPSLLVLDNCDYVVPECAALVEALLEECAGLHVLATSREALGVRSELVWRVGPLSLPPVGETAPGALLRSGAVQLFVERAREGRPDFALDERNAGSVAEICRRLDGVPLAIELAAARITMLSPAQIEERLGDAFLLLRRTDRGGLKRHQSVQAAIEWSYTLLTPAEQRLLERLSVFEGGCTLDAVEDVCTLADIPREAVLDLLTHLHARSFLGADDREDTDTRYRLLETIRQFGRDQLAASGSEAAIAASHSRWAAALAEQAEPHLWGEDQARWLKRLAREHDNLRRALDWCLDADVQRGLGIAANLWRFWELSGLLQEGLDRLEAFLSAAATAGVPEGRPYARAHFGAGYLARDLGDIIASRGHITESLRVFRDVGDRREVASALRSLAVLAQADGDLPGAQRLFEEALALFREVGHDLGVGWTLRNLGGLAQLAGDAEQAREHYLQSLQVMRRVGDRPGIARALGSLGLLARVGGEYAEARALLEEALALVEEVGDQRGVVMMRGGLAALALLAGRASEARTRGMEALRLAETTGDAAGLARGLTLLAVLAIRDGEHARGVALLAATAGSAGSAGTRPGAVLEPDEADAAEAARVRALGTLGADAYEQATTRGRALSAREAVALALSQPSASPAVPGGLTERQVEVLRLIAVGASNREIASQLVISEYTVMRHVSNILQRLGVSSRAAAAAVAAGTGLAATSPSGPDRG